MNNYTNENSVQKQMERELNECFAALGPDSKKLHEKLYLYLQRLSETHSRTRSARPDRENSSRLKNKRVTRVSRYRDSQDYLHDIWILIVDKYRALHKFKAVNINGEPVQFAHYINSIFATSYGNQWSKDEKDPVHQRMIEHEDGSAVEIYFGEGSNNVDNNGVPCDPRVRQSMRTILGNFVSKHPQLAEGLKAGAPAYQAAALAGYSAPKAARIFLQFRKKLENRGATKRATGRISERGDGKYPWVYVSPELKAMRETRQKAINARALEVRKFYVARDIDIPKGETYRTLSPATFKGDLPEEEEEFIPWLENDGGGWFVDAPLMD